MSNDRFTGKPKVSLVHGSVPAGVTAKVTRDGRVVVNAPERFVGKTVKLRYRLADATGRADTAIVTVRVVKPPVIVTGAERPGPTVDAADETVVGPSPVFGVALGLMLFGAFGAIVAGAAMTARRMRRGM